MGLYVQIIFIHKGGKGVDFSIVVYYSTTNQKGDHNG